MSPTNEQGNAAQTKSLQADASTELSARRTGMSFQRTRMSADRTLMSVIRTSLSLISFGFTIFQFFSKLTSSGELGTAASAPRNFGSTLVWLGIGMLVIGILYHVQFMLGLRQVREEMGRGPHLRPEPVSGVPDPRGRVDPARDRDLRGRQHELPRRPLPLVDSPVSVVIMKRDWKTVSAEA